MYQAIEVKFLPITNHRGARYRASAKGGSVTINKEYRLSDMQNAARAAFKLAYNHDWNGKWIGGQLKNGNYVFVLRAVVKAGVLMENSFRVI